MQHLVLLAVALLAPQEAPYPSSPIRSLYAVHSESAGRTDLAGDALVLDTRGAPIEGARVALFENGALTDVAITDVDGHADLTHTKAATRLFVWKRGVALATADENGMYQHRALADGGPLLLELEDPVTVAGTLTIDGRPAPLGFELQLNTQTPLQLSASFGPAVQEALAFWDPPLERHTTRTDKDGHFRFGSLVYPHTPIPGQPLAGQATITFPHTIPRFLAANAWPEDHLRSLYLDGPREDLEIELVTGLWIEGQLLDRSLDSLVTPAPLSLFYRLAPGTRKKGPLRLDATGHFRFAVPPLDSREPPALDLVFETDVPGCRQAFHREIPPTEPGATVQLGTLSFDQEDTLLLRLVDPDGQPIVSAPRVVPVQDTITARNHDAPADFPKSWPTAAGGPPSDSSGKLLVKRPPTGWSIPVDVWGFEPRLVEPPEDGARHIEVQLQPTAELTLTADVPRSLPPERLFVQLEAEVPALRLLPGDADLYMSAIAEAASGLPAPWLTEVIPRAPWHFAISFDEARRARFADLGTRAHEALFLTSSPERHSLRLHLRNLHAAVPFHIRIFESSGAVFLDADIPAFEPGERRNLEVRIPDPLGTLEGNLWGAVEPGPAEYQVYFGAPVPVRVASVGAFRHFDVGAVFQRQGTLIVRRGSPAPGEIKLFEPAWRFDPAAPTTIELSAP
jgi:hypothetical protein